VPVTRLVLLTGMSGSGKSSVVAELRKRGFAAIDMDEPGWSERDGDGHQRWREERLQDAIDAAGEATLFVAGCAENQVAFYPQCAEIIFLSAPAHVLTARIAVRTNNPYGKRPEELAEVLEHLRTVEPLLRRGAAREIRTAMPLDRVVEEVLRWTTRHP